jgi:hypothetical protein
VHPGNPGAGHSDSSSGSDTSNDFVVVIIVLAGIAAVVGLLFCVAAWKNRPVATLRIVRTPSGEAPEEIRRAWVGVELPLRRGETKPGAHQTVGVLSHQAPEMITGYAVDGRAAVKVLASHSSEAAAWWREHAPHVLAPGYRLWFPCEVCDLVGVPPP